MHSIQRCHARESSAVQDDGPPSATEPGLLRNGRSRDCAAACGKFGGVVISNLYRVLLLAIIITLIVLVSINVRTSAVQATAPRYGVGRLIFPTVSIWNDWKPCNS